MAVITCRTWLIYKVKSNQIVMGLAPRIQPAVGRIDINIHRIIVLALILAKVNFPGEPESIVGVGCANIGVIGIHYIAEGYRRISFELADV